MKRNILTMALALVAGIAVQAQILEKIDGEQIKFTTEKLVRIVPEGDSITFEGEKGLVYTFDIAELHSLGFAADYTEIDKVESSGQAAIVYDAVSATIYVVNTKDKEGTIFVFNADGKVVKRADGTSTSIADLPKGLYIVSYNMELNAKIVKK